MFIWSCAIYRFYKIKTKKVKYKAISPTLVNTG